MRVGPPPRLHTLLGADAWSRQWGRPRKGARARMAPPAADATTSFGASRRCGFGGARTYRVRSTASMTVWLATAISFGVLQRGASRSPRDAEGGDSGSDGTHERNIETLADPTGRPRLLPQYFGVLPKYRSVGYGRDLWRAAMHWGHQHNAAYQLLQTQVSGAADRPCVAEGLTSLGFVNQKDA